MGKREVSPFSELNGTVMLTARKLALIALWIDLEAMVPVCTGTQCNLFI